MSGLEIAPLVLNVLPPASYYFTDDYLIAQASNGVGTKTSRRSRSSQRKSRKAVQVSALELDNSSMGKENWLFAPSW